MNFTSDNCAGIAPEILAAIVKANDGAARSYGDDAITKGLNARFCEIFGREVVAHPVISGTAANALALATLVPPHGAILCHAASHILVDECGAPEFFTHGARTVGIEGEGGKLHPAGVEAALARFVKGDVHHLQPAALSLTEAGEFGTVYRPEEIRALSDIARARGMKLHVDGARFANALAHLGCAPGDVTWRAGVDALSFGATKNGAMGAEAVVFFDPAAAADFEFRRKKSGHLISKMRFVSAQLEAYLADGLWLRLAERANAMAARLAEGLSAVAEPAFPVEANEVFISMPDKTVAKLRAGGARFYDWMPPGDGRTLVRLVASFATPQSDIDRFVALALAA